MAADRPLYRSPKLEEIKALSDELKLHCSDEELASFEKFMVGNAQGVNTLYGIPESIPPVKYSRTIGHRPSQEENFYNAWYWKCRVEGANEGLLKGKSVAVKDNTFVAGVPMMNGSRALEGFIPEFDATVVSRLLDAGCLISGKATVPDLCCCGSSIMTSYGMVKNPWDPTRSAGGSSSGSAVLVALGETDLATGCDQGGSVRIPASSCGVVGLKPTFGLVPYTGICPIVTSIDHVGPIARTVSDCARMLQVIAGYDDDADPRQPSCGFTVPDYMKELNKSPSQLRIGVLKEGFELCEKTVRECVREAVQDLTESGVFASVDEVSIPAHAYAEPVWGAPSVIGIGAQLLEGGAFGFGAYGQQSSRLAQALQRGLRADEHRASPLIKAIHIWYRFVKKHYGVSMCARAQSLLLHIRKQYDKALKNHHVLLMPTLPDIPAKLPSQDTSVFDSMMASFTMLKNTAPFNSTHHPALSLNAGYIEGMPVGMMIVGSRWKDQQLLQVAHHVEQILKHRQRPLPNQHRF